MRSITRLENVHINTVTKLLIQAGEACAEHHDAHVRGLRTERVQCDEIWSFCYAKNKNVPNCKAAPEEAGDVWTWTAIDADSKLIISYLAGGRKTAYAIEFLNDVKARLTDRIQLTTDGWPGYYEAVLKVFGVRIDFSMLEKNHAVNKKGVPFLTQEIMCGRPDERHISTSFVERQNLSMRTRVKRLARKTNAYSKRLENHTHALSLYFTFHNFCHVLKGQTETPAMKAGIATERRDIEWILGLIEAREPPPGRPKKYKKRVDQMTKKG